MSDFSTRTELLLGTDGMDALFRAHVLIVGVGGVGGYAAELLGRAGVGHMTLVDGDAVDVSNLNRQIIALSTTVGMNKPEVMAQRLEQACPGISVTTVCRFLGEDDIVPLLDSDRFDFIVDAIDSVGPKCMLIEKAFEYGIPIISSMGAGARTDCVGVHLSKLSKTHHDGLSKAVRRRFKDTDIPSRLDVVFSEEQAIADAVIPASEHGARPTVGTVSWLPAVFGCHIAQFVVEKITGK